MTSSSVIIFGDLTVHTNPFRWFTEMITSSERCQHGWRFANHYFNEINEIEPPSRVELMKRQSSESLGNLEITTTKLSDALTVPFPFTTVNEIGDPASFVRERKNSPGLSLSLHPSFQTTCRFSLSLFHFIKLILGIEEADPMWDLQTCQMHFKKDKAVTQCACVCVWGEGANGLPPPRPPTKNQRVRW